MVRQTIKICANNEQIHVNGADFNTSDYKSIKQKTFMSSSPVIQTSNLEQ